MDSAVLRRTNFTDAIHDFVHSYYSRTLFRISPDVLTALKEEDEMITEVAEHGITIQGTGDHWVLTRDASLPLELRLLLGGVIALMLFFLVLTAIAFIALIRYSLINRGLLLTIFSVTIVGLALGIIFVVLLCGEWRRNGLPKEEVLLTFNLPSPSP